MARSGGGSVRSRRPEGARVLSVDLGSSSVRAELYDGSGDNVEGTETKLDYELEYTPDGGVTRDADELLDLVARAVDGALSRTGDIRISGVAMSTFWHALLGLDREGHPTTPVLTWADRRAADAPRGLRAPLQLLARQAPVVEPREDGGVRKDRTLGLPRRLLLRAVLRKFARGDLDGLRNRALGPEPAALGRGDDRGAARRAGTALPHLGGAAAGTERRVGAALARAAGRTVVPGGGRRGLLQRGKRVHDERPASADGRHHRRDAGALEGGFRRDTRRTVVLPRGREEVRHGRRSLGRGEPHPVAAQHAAPPGARGGGRIIGGDGTGLARPYLPAAPGRRARAGVGGSGQRNDSRSQYEQHARGDPARRDGGRGAQVLPHRRDHRGRLARREGGRGHRRGPPPLPHVDRDHGRRPRQAPHRLGRPGSLEPRGGPARPRKARGTRDRGDGGPARGDLRTRP